MLRFTFPYLLFISLTALAGAILNTYHRYAAAAFAPVLLNVVLIVFAALLAPNFSQPGIVLAIGVFVAGVVQLLVDAAIAGTHRHAAATCLGLARSGRETHYPFDGAGHLRFVQLHRSISCLIR